MNFLRHNLIRYGLAPLLISSLLITVMPVFDFWPFGERETEAAPVADFNIQRRCETPADTVGTVTLTAGTDYTAPADNTKAFIRLVSTRLSGMGDTVGGGTQEADDFTWYISDPDFAGGSVVFTRAGTTNPQRFCWEIIEYVGSGGGANEMSVLDVGTVTYGTTSTTVDGSSVSPTNDADVAVFVTGQNSVESATQEQVNAGYSTSEWVSASDLPRFTRGFTGADANSISYAVVEFTGSNWGVERIEHTFTADATEETETITDVGDISRAFFHAQFRLDEAEGLDDSWAEMWISATNAVSFQTQAASGSLPSQEHAVVWVVRNSDANASTKMNVQHVSGSRAAGGTSEGAANEEDEWTDTITTVGDTAETSIMGENARSGGNGNGYPRGSISLHLNSTTGVKLYQSDDGQTKTYRFQVVEWPQTDVAPTFTQNDFEWFVDIASVTLTDVWPEGSIDLAENAVIDNTFVNNPLASGDRVRLQMSITVGTTDLSADTQAFELEYVASSSCNTVADGLWVSVGSSTSASIWRLFDSGIAHGTTEVNQVTASDVAGDYSEAIPTQTNPLAVTVGQDMEWDWPLEHNGAAPNTTYCFRMVLSGGAALNSYNADSYPKLRTSPQGNASIFMRHGNFFDDEGNEKGFFWLD